MHETAEQLVSHLHQVMNGQLATKFTSWITSIEHRLEALVGLAPDGETTDPAPVDPAPVDPAPVNC